DLELDRRNTRSESAGARRRSGRRACSIRGNLSMDLCPARRAAARCAAIALCVAAAFADTAAAEQPAPPFWLHDRSPAAPTQHGEFFAALGSSGGIQQ